MQIRPLAIEGAWEITPRQFRDDRGVFLESFRADTLAEHIGHPLQVRQTNTSVSSRGCVYQSPLNGWTIARRWSRSSSRTS